jgi:hypothetical protein
MSFERELFDELNELRADPVKYANKLKKYVDYFDGKILNIPGRRAGLATVEGVKGYTDTIGYLERQKSLDPFQPSKALFRLSKDFLAKIQRKNVDEADDVDIEKLMSKYGTFYGDFGQAVDYGSQTPEQVVINLLVSDGDPSKEQRTSLFNRSYKLIGMCKGSHKSFPDCTVILKCTEFENHFDDDDCGFLEGLDAPKEDAKPQPKYQPKVQAKPEPKAFRQPEPRQESKPYASNYQRQEPKQESRPYTRQVRQPEPKQESKPYVSKYQRAETKPEPKPYVSKYQRAETKPEPKPYVSKYQRAETKPEPKPYVSKYQRAETKPESKPYVSKYQRPETKQESKPYVSKYQRQQPNNSQVSRPYTRQVKIQEPQTDKKPASRYQRPDNKPDIKHESKSYSKKYHVEQKPSTKPYRQQAQTRQVIQTDNKRYVFHDYPRFEKPSGHKRTHSQPDIEEMDDDMPGMDPSNIVSEKRKEKVTVEGGVKKKIVTIERTLKDGSVETEEFITDAF